MACVFLGDSIAVGIGMYRPECETVAKVGITSGRYIENMLMHQTADVAVISLGVNDDPSMPTVDNLRTVRAQVTARQVVWIVPNVRDYARAAIRQVAAENNDQTLDLRRYASLIAPDRIHPTGTGYLMIAGNLRAGAETAPPPVEVAEAEPEEPAPRRHTYRLEARVAEPTRLDFGRYDYGRIDFGGYGRATLSFGRLAGARQAYERRVLTHLSGTRLAHAEQVWREPGWRVQPAMMHTMPMTHTLPMARPTARGGRVAIAAALPVPPPPPQQHVAAPHIPRVTIFRTMREMHGHRQTS